MVSVCPNAASAEANYAGPMPIIGLYIAAATTVCFVLILIDFIIAYRQSKPWIPVRFFSLNSFTLTVMGVSTKLSVDLTTYMPGLDGQLSKLCSTVFICISMGFFMPSLGTMKGSDRYANLTSLTILVVTIIVNVCMQINTGVIFSFAVEHIVIIIFMLILLWACWSSSLAIDHVLISSGYYFRMFLKKSKLVNGKMNRLESCYSRSYITNPQLLMCEYSNYTAIGMLSSLSFTILLQAILRATFLKEFQICMKYSDYKWSIWVVVAAQFFTSALGCLSITWRWISIAFHMEHNKFSMEVRGYGFMFIIWKVRSILTSDWDIHFIALNQLGSCALICFLISQSFLFYLRFGTQVLFNFIDEFVLFLIHILRISFACPLAKTPEESNDQFDDLTEYEYKKDLRKWLVKKSEDDLKSWKEKNESNLSQLLSNLSPSMLPYPSNVELERMSSNLMMNNCLQLVVVLRSAKVVLPSHLIDFLLSAFDQAFEVICFVDEYLNSNSMEERFYLRMAQEWWMTRDIDSGWFHQEVIKPALKMFPDTFADEESQPSEFQRAHNLFVEMLKLASAWSYNKFKPISKEISLRARELNTIDGLYDVIKQFVLSIMHFYLSHFPTATYQYIMDSPVDKFEARTKHVVKLYFKLESLEDKIRWQSLLGRPQVRKKCDRS